MKKLYCHLLPVLLCAALLLSGCGGSAPAPAALPETEGTELEVYCFSAGKADAFLLTTAGSAVLIDAGEKGFGQEILELLAEKGVTALDYLIITHFDQDHVGGAAKVINNFPVKAVLQSNRPKDSEEYEKYTKALGNAGIEPVTVRETLSLLLDGVAYTVDPPRKNSYAEDSSNNSSLIVSVADGENRLLLTGDAQDARLAELLSGQGTDYDFLKVPYHGCWLENLEELLVFSTPEYAVITSSEEQAEDHRTLDLLAEREIETFLTRSGPVLVTCDGETLEVAYAA